MSWTHYNPVAIHCGEGGLTRLASYTSGKTALLVTTQGMVRRGTADKVIAAAETARAVTHTVRPNPDLDELDAAADSLWIKGIDCVIALGGGSAMDSAKALSLLLGVKTSGSLSRWLRDGEKVDASGAAPLLCIPTTAGTGAEVTPFAAIWDTALNKKRSLASPAIYPKAAILEPGFTLSLPWEETLFGALDAMSHAMETLWNSNATPVSLMLARQALHMAIPAFGLVYNSPENLEGRAALQTAALLAGLAISQSKSAIAHSISYPLTLRYGMPHGLACSFTIPAIAALLDKEEAWRSDEDKMLAQQVAELMKRHAIAEHALRYCSVQDAIALAEQMFTPERAGNFLLPARDLPLERILQDSLSCQ